MNLFFWKGAWQAAFVTKTARKFASGFTWVPVLSRQISPERGTRVSLVSVMATTDALLVRIDSDLLSSVMISSEPVRNWANAVLRDALSRKVDREWCLAALGGAERLNWFRQAFPGYEDIFTHALIASFLGVTPVTLSRLRASDKHR